jgi:hypothetical protein
MPAGQLRAGTGAMLALKMMKGRIHIAVSLKRVAAEQGWAACMVVRRSSVKATVLRVVGCSLYSQKVMRVPQPRHSSSLSVVVGENMLHSD